MRAHVYHSSLYHFHFLLCLMTLQDDECDMDLGLLQRAYLGLRFDAEVLGFLPAASGQVEDGGGSHVGSFGVVGVVVGEGGALPVSVEAQGGRGRLGERGLGCRRRDGNVYQEENSESQTNPMVDILLMRAVSEQDNYGGIFLP